MQVECDGDKAVPQRVEIEGSVGRSSVFRPVMRGGVIRNTSPASNERLFAVSGRISLAVKVGYTIWLAAWALLYGTTHSPVEFLWF
jgi:hypothetical protein